MKNKLFTAMALWCCASVSPLWATTYEDPILETVAPNLATDGSGGGKYYIYHVATKKFITNGNNSNTQLSIGDTGQEITLTYDEERPPLIGQPPKVSGKGWIFNALNAPSNSGYHEIYALNASEAYVDCNDQGHTLWQVLKQDNGYYRICIASQDELFGEASGEVLTMNSSWGINGESTAVLPCVDTGLAGYENAQVDWLFVSPYAYNIYQAKKELKKELESADEKGFTDVADFLAIYNSTEANQEEITEAAATLNQKILNWQASDASEGNPIDFTDRIENSAFDTKYNGWTLGSGNEIGYQTGSTYSAANGEYEMGLFVEKWTGTNLKDDPMNIFQTLSDMPTGKYRLTANTIGYQQSDLSTALHGVYLFAHTNGIEFKGEAHTLEWGGLHNGTIEDIAPQPRNTILEFYSQGGNITIGFKTENTNCNWVGVDNFKLEYCGMPDNGMAEELHKSITSAKKLKDEYKIQNIPYSIIGEANFDNLIQQAEELVSAPNADEKAIGDMIVSVQDGIGTFRKDASSYAALSTLLKDLNTAYDESPYGMSGLPSYENYLDQLDKEYQERTFLPDDIDSIQGRAEKCYKQSIIECLVSGSTDIVDGLLTNPDFTGSNTGWSKSGDGDFKYGNNVAEVWQGSSFEVYQELAGLPEGSYKISVQGYNRQGSNADIASSWDPTVPRKDVLSYLFGNDAREKLPHLYEYQYTSAEELANNAAQISGTGTDIDGLYVPDGVAGGEAAFTLNDRTDYESSTTCYVTDNGKLRFGITMPEGPNSNNWTLFDNFHIQYLGVDDMSGATTALSARIEEADSLVNSQETMTTEARETLTTAVSNAREVIQGELDKGTYNKHITALNTAIELGTTAMKEAQTIETQALQYESDYNNGLYDLYDMEEVNALTDIVYEVLDVFTQKEEDFENIEQIKNYALDMNKAYGKMLQSSIDVSTASKVSPVDASLLIKNPDFQKESEDEIIFTTEGWDMEHDAEVAVAEDSVFEFYNSTRADLHQTLYNVCPGYYRITFYGFYRAGEVSKAAYDRLNGNEERLAKFYAETESARYSKELPSFFECVQNGKFTAADIMLPDSLFPNSGQVYHCVINDRKGARTAMNHGYYEMESYFYVKPDESIRIGIQKDGGFELDWVLIDDFHLYYLGDGEANRPEGLDDVDISDGISDNVADEKSTVVGTAWYNLNGMRISRPTQRGIYIREDKMSDGTKRTLKVLIK